MPRTLTYTVRIEPGEDGGFIASVPSLPGCQTCGSTYEDTVGMARECIQGFLEALAKAGQPIPVEEEGTATLSARVPVLAPQAA
jgi:antitoxin HicB